MGIKASKKDHFVDLKAPGDYCFINRNGKLYGIAFRCPCDTEDCRDRPILPLNGNEDSGPSWNWNGDEFTPTLTPSIKRVGGCEWHGFLTNGVFTPC